MQDRHEHAPEQAGSIPAPPLRSVWRRQTFIFCIGLLCFTSTAPAHAQTSWLLCGGALQVPDRPPAEASSDNPDAIKISADQADMSELGTSVLTGNVQVIRGTQQLQADHVTLDRPREQADAAGNVRLWDEQGFVSGTKAHVDLVTEESIVDSAAYTLPDSHAHGEAARVTMLGQTRMRIDQASYTTCNPGDEAWWLRASHVDMDRTTQIGIARNVRVMFKGVPIFYSPWLSYALDDARKTGFLTPSFRASGETGFEVTVPFYWNIAPNRDATLSARMMSRRGVLLEGEYRYLYDRGAGQLGLEVLPHDSQRGESRGSVSLEHRGHFAPRWYTDVNLDYVSDKNYFEELGTSLDIASQRFLERRADLHYDGPKWLARGKVHDYQTVDQTIAADSRPYKRLPQLWFQTTTAPRNRQLHLGLRGEFVHFDRQSSVTGQRIDIRPTLSYPVRTAASFFQPRLSLEHTHYNLDNRRPGEDDNPSRTIPTFSADSGLFFERGLRLGGGSFVQTLEPRLYYLFVPFDDQNDLPIFDTGLNSFNFSQLFREDRFSGADRVGDANQLTLAVTSRLLSARTGEEVLRASVGQIRYFRDRKVTLPDGVRETDDGSDLVAEVAARITGDWRASWGIQWSPDRSKTDKQTFGVRYQPHSDRVVNFAYRFVRDRVEQTDISFRWPFKRNWGVVGRWNYSLKQDRTLEIFGGAEYQSCCWAARAVVRRFLTNTVGEFDTALFLQLELKGLAGLGRGTAAFLRKSIPGYRNEF